MTKKKAKKEYTIVREHPRHVPVSNKNPSGVTIVDRHPRRIPGTYLDPNEIESIAKNYPKEDLIYPSSNELPYDDDNKYNETIAIWTDYFNKKFKSNPPLDPDIVKALIASESGFSVDPPGSTKAFGIAQITPSTFNILQDPNGEAKEFTFANINKKDLKNPEIAIPMATRWLYRKRNMATGKLKRSPTPDEVILEYKGLLKSSTEFKNNALKNFRENYAKLKKK